MAPQVILDKLKLTNVAYIDEVAGLRNTKELHFKVLDANHALYTIDFEMFRHMTNLQVRFFKRKQKVACSQFKWNLIMLICLLAMLSSLLLLAY